MSENAQSFLTVALILVIVGILFVFSNTFNLNVVRGISMEPTFGECTLIVSEKDSLPKDAQVNDIVIVNVLDQGSEFDKIAHRVVSNNSESMVFSTRGDNDDFYDFPNSIDGFFSYDKFLGEVVLFFPCTIGS